MNSQGLDALAALASAVPASGIPMSAKDMSNQGGMNGGVAQRALAPNASTTLAPASSGVVQNNAPGMLQPAPGITAQQWQQAVAAAAAGINALTSGSPNNLAMFAGIQQMNQNQGDNSALMALQQQLAMQQQFNYYNIVAQAQRQATGSQQQGNQAATVAPCSSASAGPGNVAAQAISLALAGRAQSALPPTHDSKPPTTNTQVVLSAGPVQAPTNKTLISMPPPPMASVSQPIIVSTVGIPAQYLHASIAPQPSSRESLVDSGDDLSVEFDGQPKDKRQQKRVANRRSAQLSRKRKKQFIEELKDENDDLRRKEQILKSIPDLIVVFDSSGKLWFVSESVSRFLDFSVDELEGTSFWDRICDDSVRLLKAAFMDSLAARQPDSDTAALGKGFWELRLVDKDGSPKVVTLNGVVHFAGDRPECVCSIRPHDETKTAAAAARKEDLAREISAGSSLVTIKHHHKSLIRVKPQQSVVSNDRSDSSSSSRRLVGKEAVRISDSGNSSGSGCSDSGSSDEQNTAAR